MQTDESAGLAHDGDRAHAPRVPELDLVAEVVEKRDGVGVERPVLPATVLPATCWAGFSRTFVCKFGEYTLGELLAEVVHGRIMPNRARSGAMQTDPLPDFEKGREGPSEALEEAEKDRLRVEAALAAQRVLPATPPRDLT